MNNPQTIKYIAMTTPRSASGDCWDFYDDRQSLSVSEAEISPIKTGLLNENGTPLYRVTVRQPIGFMARRSMVTK